MSQQALAIEAFIAYHEAGHAAVDIYFDRDIEQASIVATDQVGGVVVSLREDHEALRYEDDLKRQVPFERAMMSAMAGEIAQRRFDPASVDPHHAGSDRLLVADYLDALGCHSEEIRTAYWRLLELRTEELVTSLWPNIERIAAALLEQGVMTGDELAVAYFGATEQEG